VGKTAIVEGLAVDLIARMEDGSGLGDQLVVELEMARLLSGTHLRGSFSERLMGLKDEVLKAEGRVIIFLDEIHTWMGAGASGDGADAAGELKAALARGKFPCIGATTPKEYTRFIENDPAFKRRFETVEVGEPSVEEAVEIIRGVLPSYVEHHGVEFDDEAIVAAVHFSQRYIPDQMLPAKAIGLLDTAGSRARRTNQDRITRAVVAEVVSDRTGVPVDKLLMRDRERFLRMEEHLSASLIGHREVVQQVSQVIRRNYAGFHSGRPIGSFLFLGPTGVGKTELVKVLAEFLFRDRAAMVRIDMSEYREAHAISRLIGAPPGYVGYEHGGQLTEAVRRKPYQLVLFDEVEKAHPEVLNVLLQLLDDGHLTDGRGRKVDFSNTVIILTSNLGSAQFRAGLAAVTTPRIGFAGFGAGVSRPPEIALTPETEREVVSIARAALSPELWNRIEERLVFGPLSRDQVAEIARLQLRDSSRRLAAEREVFVEPGSGLFEFLIDHGGYDPQLGARPMRQTIQRLIEGPVSELILAGTVSPGDQLVVEVRNGELHFLVTDR
jgi:ATP-dependent Clp protease ATP-binding subunit ClpC